MAAERALVAALLAAALAGCGSPPKPRSPQQAAVMAAQQAGGRALARGDLAGALAAYRQALRAAESVEDFEGVATAHLNMAAVHARAGRAPEADAELDQVLDTPQRFPVPLLQQAAARKALAALDAGHPSEALGWADRAQEGCVGPCPLAPAMDNLRAAVALQQGDATRAASLAARAAAAATGAEHANALRLQGRALTRMGDTAAAAAVLAQALAEDRTLGLPERIALDLIHAAENEDRRGQRAASRDFYERALQVSRAAGLTDLAERASARLGPR